MPSGTRSSTAAFTVVDFTSAVELILKDDKGQVAGALCSRTWRPETTPVARAKTVVIIATGGAGRLHYQGFPTSNHYGATADGLVLGYRVQAQPCCTRIPSSTIRQAPFIRPRSLALW